MLIRVEGVHRPFGRLSRTIPAPERCMMNFVVFESRPSKELLSHLCGNLLSVTIDGWQTIHTAEVIFSISGLDPFDEQPISRFNLSRYTSFSRNPNRQKANLFAKHFKLNYSEKKHLQIGFRLKRTFRNVNGFAIDEAEVWVKSINISNGISENEFRLTSLSFSMENKFTAWMKVKADKGWSIPISIHMHSETVCHLERLFILQLVSLKLIRDLLLTSARAIKTQETFLTFKFNSKLNRNIEKVSSLNELSLFVQYIVLLH